MPNPRYKSYIICTSPRSGSTLLCRLLEETGRAGHPNSHFHNPSFSSWLQSYGFHAHDFTTRHEALSSIFGAAIAKGTGDTGIFGLRLQRGSFDFFMQQTALLYPEKQNDVDRVQAAFGRTLFIYLTRPNKLDQAISRVKATHTGLWHKAADGTELERLSEPQEPYFDADAISHHLAELIKLDDAWRVWFHGEQLDPLEVSYDELSNDPQNVLGIILNELGLEKSIADSIDPATTKLADETNRVWAKRYLAECNSS